MIHPDGQAGASANLQVPNGLTVEDLEAAEGMILEWHESGDYRAIDVVIKVYEHLTARARVRQLESR
jgi:hypothetical protein